MKIRIWAALGTTILAVCVLPLTASARGLGGAHFRPVGSFRGFNSCQFSPFCRPRLTSAGSSSRFGPRTSGGAFAGGPSDDYAVDADEGFGTDDAFRFDKPAAFGPRDEYRPAIPESPDSFDPDSR
jgi:hypothetical protein